MNVFGINIQSRKTLDAQMAALAAPATVDTDDRPELVKFGEEYDRGAAREGIDGIKAAGKAADRNSKLALYVTVPHAALYMLGLVNWDFRTPLKAGATVCEVAICLAVPFGIDQLALAACRTLGMRIASKWSKIRAGFLLAVALPASAFLNFAAPTDRIIRWGAAALVIMVGLYQVARLISPSFTKAGEDERKRRHELDLIEAIALADAAAKAGPVTRPKPSTRKPNKAELDARKRTGYDKKTKAERSEWTTTYRQRIDKLAAKAGTVTSADDLLDQAGPLDDAPVSGVPATAAA